MINLAVDQCPKTSDSGTQQSGDPTIGFAGHETADSREPDSTDHSEYLGVNCRNGGSWLEEPIEFVCSSEFERSDADETILGEPPHAATDVPANADSSPQPQAPPGTPPYLASLYEFPLLIPRQESFLFRKMNYLKYRAERLRQIIDRAEPQAGRINQIGRLLSGALEIRNQIVRSNLRLVVSIAKTTVSHTNHFEDAVSDGNVPLIRAVEIFDFERGTKFSTYATWAVRNFLYRASSRNRRQHQRFITGTDGVLERAHELRASQQTSETYYGSLRSAIDKMLMTLDGRDRNIVFERFGLEGGGRPQRFREIAEGLNISTERVRQLLTRSIGRMSQCSEAEAIELA